MVNLEQLEHSGKHWSEAMIYVLHLGIQESFDHLNELLRSLICWNKWIYNGAEREIYYIEKCALGYLVYFIFAFNLTVLITDIL